MPTKAQLAAANKRAANARKREQEAETLSRRIRSEAAKKAKELQETLKREESAKKREQRDSLMGQVVAGFSDFKKFIIPMALIDVMRPISAMIVEMTKLKDNIEGETAARLAELADDAGAVIGALLIAQFVPQLRKHRSRIVTLGTLLGVGAFIGDYLEDLGETVGQKIMELIGKGEGSPRSPAGLGDTQSIDAVASNLGGNVSSYLGGSVVSNLGDQDATQEDTVPGSGLDTLDEDVASLI